MKVNRRQFLGACLAAPLIAGLHAWRVEPVWVEYVGRDLRIGRLPASWVGRLLVQVSDLHIGDEVDDAFLDEAFARIRALRPDVVVYTGDFITYAGPRTLEKLRLHGSGLPQGRIGTLAVLGNHDYGAGWRQGEVATSVSDVVAEGGCTVLRNRVADLEGLRIGGMDDLWAGRLEVEPVLAAHPHLVLCHNPDACDLPGWDDYHGWILAGHTHGGQCRPPFLPPPILPVRNRRYTAGELELAGGRRLYISRGLGHLLRVRFNVRPEITLFRLAALS